jgi:enoyl-CoA hydratase/carnithine racemase
MGLVDYKKENHLVVITMNRPDKLNALSAELLAALAEAWARYRDDDDAWLAILTGAGRAFSAGADMGGFRKMLKGEEVLNAFDDAVARDPYFSGRLDKPTIAAVNGYALGRGFDLVLKADLRVAAEGARFQVTEAQRGGILMLWDNLPYAIAAELICGNMLTGRRAYEVGIVNQVVADDQLMDAAMKMAEEVLSRPPLALYHALRILRAMKRASIPSPDLLSDYSTRVGREMSKTEDFKEATDAFFEKRKPVFKRR